MSFTVLSRLRISAPPALVVGAILDVRNWGEWNSFVPFAQVHEPSAPRPDVPLPAGLAGKEDWLSAGRRMTMRVNMEGKPVPEIGPMEALRATPELVTVVEALDPEREGGRRGYRICWRYDVRNEWLLRAERVQEVVETEGGCEYVTWETFGGWIGSVVRLAVGGKLKERFADWGRDLKDFCEARDGEDGGQGASEE